MGVIEDRWRFSPSRRKALAAFAAVFGASPLLKAQLDPHSLFGHKRIPRVDELVDSFDFEALCYRNMTLEPYDYMAHGDGSEWNLRRNRQAFDWVDIVQGKAVDPATVDMSSTILGVPMKFPIFTAPSFRSFRSIACRIAGSGTAGTTSTRCASSSRGPSSSRAS